MAERMQNAPEGRCTMSDVPTLPQPPSDPAEMPPAGPTRRWRAWPGWVAWVAIALLVLFWIRVQAVRSERRETHEEAIGEMPLVRFQGRVLTGLAQLPVLSPSFVYEQAGALKAGPVGQRLRFVVLAGELAGPNEALNQLKNLHEEITRAGVGPGPTSKAVMEALQAAYSDYREQKYGAPSLGESQRELLRSQLNWFGELALAPPQSPNRQARELAMAPAYRAAIAFTSAIAVGIVAALGGLIGLVILLITLAWRPAESAQLAYSSVYAETFALWLGLFGILNLGLLGSWLPAGVPVYLGMAFLDLLSLAVLGWPVLRGVPWAQVRRDLGWTLGRGGFLEPVFGLAAYAMSLPFLAIGLVLVMVLLRAQAALATSGGSGTEPGLGGPPSHPAIELLADPDWWRRAQVLILAVVVAPVVEETMFRGVLYRQLRSATNRLGFWLSVLTSGLISSFIFAAIHPQGLIFVPALMGLALGFCIAREWRGTLVPGMVAHGCSNGLVMTLFMVVAG